MKQLSQMLQKTAVHFAKTGPAIYHSHHDMIRFWERAVKRAMLPVRLTQGFNPRPRIIFPHALGLGIASPHEEVELELYEEIPLSDVLERLRGAAGDTLEIRDAVALPPTKKSRQLVQSTYAVTGWDDNSLEKLPGAVKSILALGEIEVERGAPGNRRRLDIRPFVADVWIAEGKGGLGVRLMHSNAGSARPDEVAKLAASLVEFDPFLLAIEKIDMRLE